MKSLKIRKENWFLIVTLISLLICNYFLNLENVATTDLVICGNSKTKLRLPNLGQAALDDRCRLLFLVFAAAISVAILGSTKVRQC